VQSSRIGNGSPQIRSSALSSSVLSPSNSIIPMRRATIHHHPSIASLAPSRLSSHHRPTQSWTSPPTSPRIPTQQSSNPALPLSRSTSPPTQLQSMPIINLALKPQSSLPNFPLPPQQSISTHSTDSISSLQIPPTITSTSKNPLQIFPFRNSIIASSSSLPIFPDPPQQLKHKRNSGILKSLQLEPLHIRKKSSLSSLPTPSFPSLSPRKRFKSVDEALSRSDTLDTTSWDDYIATEQDPRVKERVEMSFESVRLEKFDPTSPAVVVGSICRNVSSGSGVVETPLIGTPAELGWMSPSSVLKGGFKWS